MAALQYAARRSLLRQTKAQQLSRQIFTRAAPAARSSLTTGLYATALVLSTGLFAVYYFDARSAIHRYVIMPILRHTLDAETSHQVAVKVLRSGLGPKDSVVDDEKLKFELWGNQISNPVGLAAGFDKDGEAIDGLFDLGFSWVEIGSITPKPQPGNPKPRVFRLSEDAAVINRYGFPSQGHATVLARVRARLPKFLTGEGESNASLRNGSFLAINLGKNKKSEAESIDDFVAGVLTFGPYSDVLVINVSSPNTPGLRGLQNKASLEALLRGVTQARDSLPPSYVSSGKPRLVVKLAPDLDHAQLEDIAQVIRDSKIDGVIISNTTVQRPAHLIASRQETGGLSGQPIKPYTLAALKTLRANLPSNVPIIGCGGISTGEDALEYARAGASMVQIYTSFGYDGAGTCRRIKDEIAETLRSERTTWAEVVQKATEELSLKELPKKKSGEGSVQDLIEEARHLNELLDQLGKNMTSADQREMAKER